MGENYEARGTAGNRNPGIVTGTGPGENLSGAAERSMDLKAVRIEEIAALPLDELRKLLDQAAEHAAHEYETNKELTVLTDRLGALDFFEECR